MNLTELRARLSAIADEQAAIYAEPGDTLTPEQEQRFDALTTEATEVRSKIDAAEKRAAQVASIRAAVASQPAAVEQGAYTPAAPSIVRQRVENIFDLDEIRTAARSRQDERQLLRDSAMRAVERETFPVPSIERSVAQAHVARLLDSKDSEDKELARRILQTGSPEYVRMFAQVVRGKPLTNEEQRYAALEVVGTTTTGGYAVPYAFDPTIIPTGAYTNINPFRQICRVEQIVGANKWQGVSAGAVLAQYDTESDAVPEGGPTFSNPSVTVTRATSTVSLSYETMQDRSDIVSEIAALIGEAKDTLEENKFSVGAGSNNSPLGMFVKSTFTVKETITDDTFAVADLDATEAALPLRFRRDAVWMLSRGVIRIIQGWETAYGKLFNSTLGYPAVGDIRNNPGGNTGMSLLGYPVWETPSAPTTVTTDDTIVGILVAPRNYLIVDRVGMEIEVIPNLFDTTTGLPTGRRAILAVWRNSAKTVNADAGRQININ